MADDVDIAGPQQDAEIAWRIARTPRPGGVSAELCVDCYEEIPLRRREAYAGCQRCAPCQSVVERMK